MGELAYLAASRRTLADLAGDWWELYSKPNLAYNTLVGSRRCSIATPCRASGGLRLREVTPEVLARFRADLEAAGVGRHAVRVSLVIVQAMLARVQS